MFRIDHDNNHDKYTAKVHYVSTREIAEEVVADLDNRFSGKFAIREEAANDCMWDPGGMMMTDDEVFSFPLSNLTVRCKAQHFDYFVQCIQDYEPRGKQTKFIKIHGHYTCICLTVQEFDALKLLVSCSEYSDRARVAWDERERRLNKLEEQGDIVRVVKGDDGQLYKAAGKQEIDKKLLN